MKADRDAIGPRHAGAGSERPDLPRCVRSFRQRSHAAALCGLIFALAAAVSSVHAQTAAGKALAEVNGEAITAKDVEKSLGAKLGKLEEQIYTLKRAEIDAQIAQRLLAQEAAKRGIPVATLMDQEITSKVALVTEKEIDDYYNANKARIRGDEATARPQIRSRLQQEKLTARREAFLASLRSKATIVVRLESPPAVRVEVDVAGAPIRGPAEAPVTVIEFSDFECPFCKRAKATFATVMEKYPGKIRLAFRDFPLEKIHPLARGAAEAARCARDGGKFWEYHDVLFAQSPKLTRDDLKRYAKDVGLDTEKFDACVASGAKRAAVQKDIDDGTELGITGTPAFYINGRPLVGAQPIEAFTRIIDEELARTVSAKAK
jgi:protein-disulfide isomerase